MHLPAIPSGICFASRTRNLFREANMGVRNFRDADGNAWQVWQVAPRSEVAPLYAGSMTHGWLCFESGSEKRRLPDPPAGWGEWPDEALERLCRAAEPARPAPLLAR
jgi:hypothetical protein